MVPPRSSPDCGFNMTFSVVHREILYPSLMHQLVWVNVYDKSFHCNRIVESPLLVDVLLVIEEIWTGDDGQLDNVHAIVGSGGGRTKFLPLIKVLICRYLSWKIKCIQFPWVNDEIEGKKWEKEKMFGMSKWKVWESELREKVREKNGSVSFESRNSWLDNCEKKTAYLLLKRNGSQADDHR